jgi:type IV fimbrial biogenesis protein FimT
MVGLGVAAVLAGLAAPGFAAFRRSAGVSSAANELVWALHLARSSAVLRGLPVTVCLSRDERTCLQSTEGAAEGWLVFQAAGQTLAAPAAPSGPVLHSFRLPEAVTVHGTRPAVTFWPVSRAGTTGTFEICDEERRTPGRSIVVSQTGRPRVAAEAASCAG